MSRLLGHFMVAGRAQDMLVYDDSLVCVWTGWSSVYRKSRLLGGHPVFLGAGLGGAGLMAGVAAELAGRSFERLPAFGSPEETAARYERATLIRGGDVETAELRRASRFLRGSRALTLNLASHQVTFEWIVRSSPHTLTIPILQQFLGTRLAINVSEVRPRSTG